MGTRELPLPPLPYVVVYSVNADAVEIPLYQSVGYRSRLQHSLRPN